MSGVAQQEFWVRRMPNCFPNTKRQRKLQRLPRRSSKSENHDPCILEQLRPCIAKPPRSRFLGESLLETRSHRRERRPRCDAATGPVAPPLVREREPAPTRCRQGGISMDFSSAQEVREVELQDDTETLCARSENFKN